MKNRDVLVFAAIAVVGLLWGCSSGEGKKAEPGPAVTVPAAEPPQADAAVEFDLGGPCLEKGTRGRVPNAYLRQEELRKAGEWDQLIEAMKDLVRHNCDMAFSWGELFKALADSGRSADALRVADTMARRGFPPSHAVLSKTAPRFLESAEFQASALGREYTRREGEVQATLKQAEESLNTMGKDLPPNPYRSRGACPFECCTYRQWKTVESVRLVESIHSSTVVAEIPAGADVIGVTGEVHVEPEPYAVVADIGLLKAGEVVFFLDNEGEGYVNYWYRGKVKPELGLGDGLWSYVDDELRKMRPDKKFLNEWWVKIRTSDGKEGWALNTGQFTNVDQCG